MGLKGLIGFVGFHAPVYSTRTGDLISVLSVDARMLRQFKEHGLMRLPLPPQTVRRRVGDVEITESVYYSRIITLHAKWFEHGALRVLTLFTGGEEDAQRLDPSFTGGQRRWLRRTLRGSQHEQLFGTSPD